MKKIAVILHGLSSGNNDLGLEVNTKYSLSSLKDKLGKDNILDFYFHTWGAKNKSLLSFLKPKNYRFDAPIYTGYEGTKIHSIISRFKSLDNSVNIFLEKCQIQNLKYDVILITRFDLFLFRNIIPREIEENEIFFPDWFNPFNGKNILFDLYFILGKKSIENFSGISKFTEQFLKNNNIKKDSHPLCSSHIILFEYAKERKIPLKYYGKEYRDFCVYRQYKRFIKFSEKPHYYFSKQQIFYFFARFGFDYKFKLIYSKIYKFFKHQ